MSWHDKVPFEQNELPLVNRKAYWNISPAPRVRAPQSGQTQPPRGIPGENVTTPGLSAKGLPEPYRPQHLHTLIAGYPSLLAHDCIMDGNLLVHQDCCYWFSMFFDDFKP
ncbi:hypothetical protein LXL04_014149 [Taraxacum kok-saghyz]